MRIDVTFRQVDSTALEASFGQCQVVTVLEKNYEELENLPKLDGRPIIGDVPELDPTVPEWAKRPVKPSYTAKDVGALADEDMMPLTAADLGKMWELFN